MTPLQTLKFEILIEAPVEQVYQTMIDPADYRDWTSAFAEGSHYEGSWDAGASIRFLAPSGDGMLSEIAENRPNAFISIRHVGMIDKGVEDRSSDAVKAWAGACENYRFQAVPQGTRLDVEQQITPDWAEQMQTTWPQALLRLKALCEARARK